MKFPELIIENFLAITEAKLNLADRGLVVIQGINHADSSADSNGAGKSSIADALCWVWFGETARGVSGDDVINRDAKKNTRVSSTVVDGHMTYTATRHRKHKTGKNTLTITAFDGFKTVDLTKGTDKLTQEVANQIIGSSLEVFQGSIYAGQEKMPDLPAMTDKFLKMLIEEAAGVTVLEAAYRKARDAHTAAVAAEAAQARLAAGVTDKINRLTTEVAAYEGMVSAWALDLARRVQDATDRIVAALPELKSLKASVDAIDILNLQTHLAAIEGRIAAVGAENTELLRLDRELTSAGLNLKTLQNRIKGEELRLQTAAKEIDTALHKVGYPCTECGRPLTNAEIASAKSAADTRFKAVEAELDKSLLDETAAIDAVVKAQDARDRFAASMTDISAASAQRASLQREIDSYNALVTRQQVATANARNLKAQLEAVKAEANPHEPRLVTCRAELAAAKQELVVQTETFEKLAHQTMIEAEVVKVFGPTGVRARILDEVTPFLNDQTAKYLGTLSDGNIDATWTTLTANAKGELKEKFSIDVTNATGGSIFKALSGGEKRKVRVATALALQDLVATRATKPIDLFIGDEIDDALDPAGLERLTMILEEKARERGSVFVISHNEMRDHIKQVLQVEKLANGTTKITEMAA
ncbi:MAG: hypothetical protein DI537_14600 [Stutzerimonas stutzeri]|nr:MAG: hypothetical protein DI537_14600 [Stutzerimonas stutzeri]